MGKTKRIPQRMCIGCRQMRDKKDLIRIVCGSDGEILIDRTGKAGGRGTYICKNPDCVNAVMLNHGLERSLKTRVQKEVFDELKKEMI